MVFSNSFNCLRANVKHKRAKLFHVYIWHTGGTTYSSSFSSQNKTNNKIMTKNSLTFCMYTKIGCTNCLTFTVNTHTYNHALCINDAFFGAPCVCVNVCACVAVWCYRQNTSTGFSCIYCYAGISSAYFSHVCIRSRT